MNDSDKKAAREAPVIDADTRRRFVLSMWRAMSPDERREQMRVAVTIRRRPHKRGPHQNRVAAQAFLEAVNYWLCWEANNGR